MSTNTLARPSTMPGADNKPRPGIARELAKSLSALGMPGMAAQVVTGNEPELWECLARCAGA